MLLRDAPREPTRGFTSFRTHCTMASARLQRRIAGGVTAIRLRFGSTTASSCTRSSAPHPPGPWMAGSDGATARSSVIRSRQADASTVGSARLAACAACVIACATGRGRGNGGVWAAATLHIAVEAASTRSLIIMTMPLAGMLAPLLTRASAGLQRRDHAHARQHDPSPVSDLGAAVAVGEDRRQRPPVGRAKPEPKQVALALGLRPILVIGAVMQDHVVMKELYIAGPKRDIEIVRRVVRKRVEQIERLDLPFGQPRRVGRALRGRDVVPVAVDDRELAGMPVKHRGFVVAFPARRHFAATIEAKRLKQDGRQIGTATKHLVVEENRAHDAAQATGLGRLQAQQRDNVGGVRVKGLLVRRLIDARIGIFDTPAEVLHMAQDMSLAVLRYRPAEMRADAEKGGRRLRDRIAPNRNAADD